jgi:hypothetical protein
VEYVIRVEAAGSVAQVPAQETVVARFRDPVPAGILVPHILAMFASMLVSTRALFEVMRQGVSRGRGLVLTAMGFLVVGGLFLGPLVQKFAFGAYWTGWPNGSDLTDNKTLIAFLAWLPATIAAAREMRLRLVVALGWVVMMGVFLIPHSMRGSEIDGFFWFVPAVRATPCPQPRYGTWSAGWPVTRCPADNPTSWGSRSTRASRLRFSISTRWPRGRRPSPTTGRR